MALALLCDFQTEKEAEEWQTRDLWTYLTQTTLVNTQWCVKTDAALKFKKFSHNNQWDKFHLYNMLQNIFQAIIYMHLILTQIKKVLSSLPRPGSELAIIFIL